MIKRENELKIIIRSFQPSVPKIIQNNFLCVYVCVCLVVIWLFEYLKWPCIVLFNVESNLKWIMLSVKCHLVCRCICFGCSMQQKGQILNSCLIWLDSHIIVTFTHFSAKRVTSTSPSLLVWTYWNYFIKQYSFFFFSDRGTLVVTFVRLFICFLVLFVSIIPSPRAQRTSCVCVYKKKLRKIRLWGNFESSWSGERWEHVHRSWYQCSFDAFGQ